MTEMEALAQAQQWALDNGACPCLCHFGPYVCTEDPTGGMDACPCLPGTPWHYPDHEAFPEELRRALHGK